MENPFFYGNPIPPDLFIGRKRELRRIVSRIRNRGQSSAIVGEPRCGKTSLLQYLGDSEARSSFGDDMERLVFSYLDAQVLGGDFSPARFWESTLQPWHEAMVEVGSKLKPAYQTCAESGFGTFALERLLARMREEGWRLVLLLDELDQLLHHPVLNSAEFFGSLRGLTSRSRGALALVTGSRSPLTQLNESTQELNRTGSPYFNFLDEITLGPLSGRQTGRLLKRAKERFTAHDRDFVTQVAGGQPYLLQVVASALWNIYEEQLSAEERWQEAGQIAYDQASITIRDTWRLWSPATRKVLTSISLAHLSTLPEVEELLPNRSFYVERLLADLRDFGFETRALKKQGFIVQDEQVPGGWRVRPFAYLWWMAEEVTRTVRADAPLEEWLQAQEWGELMTHGEKEKMSAGIRSMGKALKSGATALIEAAAKGIGDGI